MRVEKAIQSAPLGVLTNLKPYGLMLRIPRLATCPRKRHLPRLRWRLSGQTQNPR